MSPVVLRSSLPPQVLFARFLDAIGDGVDVDLVVEGKKSVLLPALSRRLRLGGKDAAAATLLGLPLFPQVILLLLQAKRLGRTWKCRRVHGAREAVLEIRLRDPSASP